MEKYENNDIASCLKHIVQNFVFSLASGKWRPSRRLFDRSGFARVFFFCCTSCCGSCCCCCCGCSSEGAGWIGGSTVADASGGSSLRVFRYLCNAVTYSLTFRSSARAGSPRVRLNCRLLPVFATTSAGLSNLCRILCRTRLPTPAFWQLSSSSILEKQAAQERQHRWQ